MRKLAIAFDMDGTLYSSEPLIEKVYADSIQEYNQKYNKNLHTPTFKEIEPLIGLPVRDIYLSLFQGITEMEMGQLGKIIGREFQAAIFQHGGKLFDGVRELFDFLTLNHYKIFIASNGKREYLSAILNKFALKTEPFICVGENQISRKGQILQYYLDYYQLLPDHLVMVGDRSSDLEAAREVNCLFIGCDFGHGEAHELENADVLVSSLPEIKDIISSFKKIS